MRQWVLSLLAGLFAGWLAYAIVKLLLLAQNNPDPSSAGLALLVGMGFTTWRVHKTLTERAER